jgi:hypothetical protein
MRKEEEEDRERAGYKLDKQTCSQIQPIISHHALDIPFRTT